MNLVKNGDFTYGVKYWTGVEGTLSAVASRLRLTSVTDKARARQRIVTHPGTAYTLSLDVVSLGSNDELTVALGNTAGAADVTSVTYDATETGATFDFTAEKDGTWLDLCAQDTLSDAPNVDVDNVSITPSDNVRPFVSIPEPIVLEGAWFDATVRCRNGRSAATPLTLHWKLACIETGKDIQPWTAATVTGDETTIEITAAMNVLKYDQNAYERKQLTVETNRGTSVAMKDNLIYRVQNIRGF